ncbi:hypothetical protein LEMLEM_LOCUS11189 [Lemmus lemmus]
MCIRIKGDLEKRIQHNTQDSTSVSGRSAAVLSDKLQSQ